MRLLHSLRAEWSVGSSCSAGWEGEEEGRGRRRPRLEEGTRPVGREKAGGEGWRRGAGREPGWAQRLPLHFPRSPAVAPFCKAITAVLIFPAWASWNLADQEGFCPCCPLPQTQQRITPFDPSSRPTHIPRLLCEMTQQQSLPHLAFHGGGVPKRYCSLTPLLSLAHLKEGAWTGSIPEPISQLFHKRKTSISS